MLIQSSGRMVNSVDVEHQRSEEFMDRSSRCKLLL